MSGLGKVQIVRLYIASLSFLLQIFEPRKVMACSYVHDLFCAVLSSNLPLL